ncbi:MAG: GntR family transcriptional regulator [Planctomycetes bacterium]|nr:GntR family transcriptional regulator [Planctomycetota bacterium]
MPSGEQTKYMTLAGELQRDIAAGRFEVGKRFPSERSLVKTSGLSLLTVRQALSVLEKRGLILRRQGAGTFVVSTSPVEERVWLAVLVMGFDSEMSAGYQFIYSQWMRGVCRAVDRARAHLSIVDLGIVPDPPGRFHELADQEKGPSGFLMPLVHRWMMPRLLGEGGRASVPHAVIGDARVDQRLNAVVVDMAGAGRAAAGKFHSLGHTRMAYLGAEANLRGEGWIEELKSLGLWERNRDLMAYDAEPTSVLMLAEEQGYLSGRRLLAMDDPPTAVFCMNDSRARGLVRAAAELGFDVPADLSVIGFDNMPGSDRLQPPLTTFAPPWEDVGYAAADSLLTWVSRKARFRRSFRLHKVPVVDRGSVAPPRRLSGEYPS